MIKKSNTAVICLSPYGGGMEIDSFRIAKLLSSISNVTLIAKYDSFIHNNYSADVEKNNISLKIIKFSSNISFSIMWNARKIIKENNIKNVIFFGASELKSLYFSFTGLDINLMVRHGTTKSSPKHDFLHRLIYSNVNWHIAICKHIENNVKYIVPFGKKSQIKTIYSSLRNSSYDIAQESFRTCNPVQLLHTGRIADGKGQLEAVQACNILYEEGIPFELYCIGEIDPNYSTFFLDVIGNLPYRESIFLPGYTDNVFEYYKKADIFLFPSKGEGLSNSFIEALSFGLLCIAYKNTSFPELKELGFDILLAENGNIDDLQQQLFKAVTQLRDIMIPNRNNTDLANNLFNQNKELSGYEEILE